MGNGHKSACQRRERLCGEGTSREITFGMVKVAELVVSGVALWLLSVLSVAKKVSRTPGEIVATGATWGAAGSHMRATGGGTTHFNLNIMSIAPLVA